MLEIITHSLGGKRSVTLLGHIGDSGICLDDIDALNERLRENSKMLVGVIEILYSKGVLNDEDILNILRIDSGEIKSKNKKQ